MWKTAYLETRVLSASPVELINILYEYAILSVQDARDSLARGDIAARAKSIAKAIAILGELDSSLDRGAGGEIAVNLGKLYQYMRERLSLANLKQADEPLAEVEKLLQTLGEAWQQISGDQIQTADEPVGGNGSSNWGAFQTMATVPDYGMHSWSA